METNYNPVNTFNDLSSHSQSSNDHKYDEIDLSNGIELQEVTNNIRESSRIDMKSLETRNMEASLLNRATQSAMYANLTSTLLGSGILGLPYAFSRCGYILGYFMVILCGSLSYMGLLLLYLCATKAKLPVSFHSVASISSLSNISIIIDSAVFIKCLGVASSYPIIIGDLMPSAMRQLYSASTYETSREVIYNRNFWIFVTLLVSSPLCCFRSLDALKWTSSVSVMCVFLLTVLLFCYSIRLNGLNPCEVSKHSSVCSYDYEAFLFSQDTLRTFPTFIFIFTCQHNTFTVINELKSPTSERIKPLFAGAIITASIFYLIVASTGYATYGTNIFSNALKSYPDSPVTSIARITICIIAAFHYPIQCNPGRKSAMSIWKQLSGDIEPSATVYMFRYICITLFFIVFTFTLAFSTDDLGKIFSIIGATGSTSVTYIIPGLCYYNLHRHQGPIWLRYYSLIHLSIGMIIAPIALTFIFLG